MGKAELRLEIDGVLLARARAASLAIEPFVEQALRAALPPTGLAAANARQNPVLADAEARGRRWAEDNAEAIKAYGDRIEREGCFGEEWRAW